MVDLEASQSGQYSLGLPRLPSGLAYVTFLLDSASSRRGEFLLGIAGHELLGGDARPTEKDAVLLVDRI